MVLEEAEYGSRVRTWGWRLVAGRVSEGPVDLPSGHEGETGLLSERLDNP